jgi:hypothetical protein
MLKNLLGIVKNPPAHFKIRQIAMGFLLHKEALRRRTFFVEDNFNQSVNINELISWFN